MKHIGILGLIISLSAILLGSCAKETAPTPNKTIEFEAFAEEKVFRLEDSAREFNNDEDVLYTYSAKLILPVTLYDHDITALKDSISSIAFDTIAEPLSAFEHRCLTTVDDLGYSAVEVSDSLANDEAGGFTIIKGEIYSLSNSLLTYRINYSIYLPGAAHGMLYTSFINYDLNKGEILTLKDLFTKSGLEKLPTLISTRAKALRTQLGPTSIEALPSDGNFYITLDDEIVFAYQPYEVASYAQGLICVPFYPFQLSELMTEQGLTLFGLTDED